jgi:hypothetical protein
MQYQVAQHGRNLRYDAGMFSKQYLFVADFADLALARAQVREGRE